MGAWVFFFALAIGLGYAAYSMHQSHKSPEAVVRAYLHALCKGQAHHALMMVAPPLREEHAARIGDRLGTTLIGIHVTSQPSGGRFERRVTAEANTEEGCPFVGTYHLKVIHQLRFIHAIDEES